MRILVTNAVPLNGGDELLIRASIAGLASQWPEAHVTILCRDAAQCRLLLPDLTLASDLDHASDEDEFARVLDLVLSAPGGYLHDHYEVEARLRSFEVALDMGKPLVLLPQSVGPFWKADSIRRVKEVLDRATAVFVRDSVSRDTLLRCGVSEDLVHMGTDVAFLWHGIAPELFRVRTGSARHVGMCFRAWPLGDEEATGEIVDKAVRLCEDLLADRSRRLTFLSTCQGVAGYVDDSIVAGRIVARLSPPSRGRCDIDRERRHPAHLIAAMGRLDAYVGMRLHGCISALLAGTPTMGIGYETKTEQIFMQMGFASYQLPQSSGADEWLQGASRFLADLDAIRERLPSSLDAMRRSATECFARLAHSVRAWHGQRRPRSPWSYGEGLATSVRYARILNDLSDKIAWRRRAARARLLVDHSVSDEAKLILVDQDLLREELVGRRTFFPFLERDGQYGGPPEDDAAALRELERLRGRGARFLVVAWPAYWWLDHYAVFFENIRTRHPCVAKTTEIIVYDLGPASLGEGGFPQTLSDEVANRSAIVEQVRDRGLTYLDAAALLDLKRAVFELEARSVEGHLVEAGCALGGSALVLAASKAPSRSLFVYDVFGMIPPPCETEEAEVRERYSLIESGRAAGIGGGRYYGYEKDLLDRVKAQFRAFGLPPEENAVHFVRGPYQDVLNVEAPLALAHIDCDWYESVKICLERIEPHLVPGGRLIVDDYFRWSGCRRAVDEYFRGRGDRYRFEARARLHVIRIG